MSGSANTGFARNLIAFPQFCAKVSWIRLAPVLALAACSTPVVTTSPNGCSSLIPSEWSKGVPGAPLPDGNSVGDWISFGDAQTGKLDTANGRTRDAIEIQARCEARDAAVIKHATRTRLFGIPL